MDVESTLQDVILLSVVVASGCERCAEQAVDRASSHGVPADLIRRTLGIVAGIRAQECFAQAVGPEVAARMEKPLDAGRKAQQRSGTSKGGAACCDAPAAVR